MTYEFFGLKSKGEGEKTYVIFNSKVKPPLRIEAANFAFSQFSKADDIGYWPRLHATTAMIQANVDLEPVAFN